MLVTKIDNFSGHSAGRIKVNVRLLQKAPLVLVEGFMKS